MLMSTGRARRFNSAATSTRSTYRSSSEGRLRVLFFFFQAEDGIRDYKVTGVQTCALPILPPIPRREPIKKRPALFPDSLRAPQQSRRTESEHSQCDVRVPRQLFKSVVRNLPPKIIAGHVLHFVRFVKHHRGIFRQDAPEIVLLQRQVREKQMVIDDDQVRFARPLM